MAAGRRSRPNPQCHGGAQAPEYPAYLHHENHCFLRKMVVFFVLLSLTLRFLRSSQSSINPHIWSAAPQKRYQNFLHTVCDWGAVWLVRSGDAPLCFEQGLMLWPAREDAEEYLHRQGHAADCTVDYVDVLLFLHLTEAAPKSDFQIFPTEKDAFSMSGKAL